MVFKPTDRVMKKDIFNSTKFVCIGALFLLFMLSSQLNAQTSLYMTGQQTVEIGQEERYSVSGEFHGDMALYSYVWEILDKNNADEPSIGEAGVLVNPDFSQTYMMIKWLIPGDYTLLCIVDDNDESYDVMLDVTVTAPNPDRPRLSWVTQPTCTKATGSFIITNHDPLYTYVVNPSNGVTINGNTVTTPAGNDYMVTAHYIVNGTTYSSSSDAEITINTAPTTPSAPTVGSITHPTISTATGSVTLTGLPSGTWTINPGNITGSGSSKTITGLTASETYDFTVTNTNGCTSGTSRVVINDIPPAFCGHSDQNYIYTLVPQIATADVGTLTEDDQKIESVAYFDGLGRPKQNIGIRAGGNHQDIITHIGYDGFGRQDKDWLPYATTSNCGAYQTTAENDTKQDYYDATKFDEDFIGLSLTTVNPYSQKRFESSPLNRVLEQGAPGRDWILNESYTPDNYSDDDTDHTIKFEYTANLDTDYVRIFSVNIGTWTYKPSLVDTEGTYLAGELYKTITKDENWTSSDGKDKTTEEYKNKQGQVILKRTYNYQRPHDTYYVYDDFGNLTYVLPPKMNTTASIVEAFIPEYIYETGTDIYPPGVSTDHELEIYFETEYGSLDLYFYEYNQPNSAFKSGKVMDINTDTPLPNMNLGTINYHEWSTGNTINAGTASIVNGELHISSSGNVINSSGDFYFFIDLEPYQSTFTPNPITSNDLNQLGYRYQYDSRNRLVEKSVPGKGLEYIIYDKLDRPVMIEDPNLRLQHKWLFTSYDAFGRVSYTGKYTQDPRWDRYSMQKWVNTGGYLKFVDKSSSRNINGVDIYYPKCIATNTDSNIEILTINYYDDYNVDRPTGLGTTVTTSYGLTSSTNTKGLPTVSKVRVLDTNNWITTVTYYDKKARPIYIYSENEYLGTVDIVENELDFTGKVLETKTTHTKDNNTPIETIDKFEYDHVGRLISQKQIINNNTANEELIVKNHYDDLGQLIQKDVGNNESRPLQEVDYSYNIRGWLKEINKPESLGADLFGFGINYNTPDAPTTSSWQNSWYNKSLYNGNISHTYWNSQSPDGKLRHYTYRYDNLNRLTRGHYAENTFMSKYNLYINGYDKNGNIERLSRNMPSDLNNPNSTGYVTMDYLFYTYDIGNRLTSVRDSRSSQTYGSKGFKDGTNTGDDYAYDNNGNMLKDLNKGIENIIYNHLNLPKKVTIDDGGSNNGFISYIYDATGVKLKKIVSTGATTEYAGNYVYEDTGSGSSLKFFNHPEGYVSPELVSGSIQYDYVYQYKDHLGNVRLSYKDISTTSTPNLEILEENNYYPFGLKHKGYNNSPTASGIALDFTYNGKEFDESLNLNTFDLGARHYDPAIGRFMTIDPMADFINYQSPYVMADNNPIHNIDFYGLGSKPPGTFFGSLLRSIRDLFQKKDNRAPPGTKNRRNKSRATGLDKNKKSSSGTGITPPDAEYANGDKGASQLNFDFSNLVGNEIGALPAKDIPELRPPNIRIPNPYLPERGGLIRFDEDILFVEGTTTMSHPNVARKTLNDLLKTLQDYPHLKVIIEGNTAGKKNATASEKHMDDEEDFYPLQSGRANAIRRFLIENGILSGRLKSRRGKHRYIGQPGRKTTFIIVNPK